MKRIIVIFIFIASFLPAFAWAPAGDKIKTKWASEVSPTNARPEYPRPQMVRPDWLCLNGLWDYAITRDDVKSMPKANGEILVPFCVESSLSGVGATLKEDEILWYRRKISIPQEWAGKRVLLHFDAVDWRTEVFLGGEKLGEHLGGYAAFSFDITGLQKEAELIVRVWDPTDLGTFFGPHGKQHLNPERKNIYYTPVSGIWQSVWMEAVPMEAYIKDYYVTTSLDGRIKVDPKIEGVADQVVVQMTDSRGRIKAKSTVSLGSSVELTLKNPVLWTPDNPYLYGLKINLIKDGKIIDTVDGYSAIRTIGIKKDESGVRRLALNDQILFQLGTLDQGWWPDGLYTAPTAEAMAWDIEKTKELGFNMIRKHVKVEPSRWYYDCDRLGILVWQDMPCLTRYKEKSDWAQGEDRYGAGKDTDVSQEMKQAFYQEWKEIIEQFKKFPCIYSWVPFNEAWGQFDTKEVADLTAKLDPTRLVNAASGGNWVKGAGDILDSHHYPDPQMRIIDSEMVNVLGEFGGIGRPVKGHTWYDNENWGYVVFDDEVKCSAEYALYCDDLIVIKQTDKCAAAVYTQTTDVEEETNGLFTYDRKVQKFNTDVVRTANQKVIAAKDICSTPLVSPYSFHYKLPEWGWAGLWTLKNGNTTLQVTNDGARIISLFVPNKKGKQVNIFDGYSEDDQNRQWKVTSRTKSSISLLQWRKSKEDGYPGTLKIELTYTLNDEGNLEIDYEVSANKRAKMTLTNHRFNVKNGCGIAISSDYGQEVSKDITFSSGETFSKHFRISFNPILQ